MSNGTLKIQEHLTKLEESATLSINQISLELIQAGKKVIRFGFGQSPFPVPEDVVDALKDNAYQKDYLNVQGLPELREMAGKHLEKLTGLKYSPSNIFVGPGSKELIHLIQLIIQSDLILPSPSWVSYAPQAYINKKNVHWIDTTKTGLKLSAKDLDELCENNGLQGAILILNYPGNPTGQSFEEVELKALAKVARKNRLIVISDEIYGLLSFNGDYNTIAKYYPEGTLISSGLSKWCGAGGWRLGIMYIPEQLDSIMSVMRQVASETFSAVSAPIQYAAITAFESPISIEKYLEKCRFILSRASELCYRQIANSKIKTHRCIGGFYYFLDFNAYASQFNALGITGSKAMCDHLLYEKGVAMLPGSAFGRPENDFSSRMAFVDFDGQRALEIVTDHNLNWEAYENELFSDLKSGLDHLVDWLNTL